MTRVTFVGLLDVLQIAFRYQSFTMHYPSMKYAERIMPAVRSG
jgi:hypothetical protein